jgi:hypothetical protein
MILSDLRAYLEERGEASVADMALHFDTAPDALRPMLEVWLKKGKVERFTISPNCGGNCNRCAPEVTEIYRWRGVRGKDREPG